MTISIWRYSHLALAVSSFLLLTLAAVTGVILSFEPVSQKLQPYHTSNFNRLTLAQTLQTVKQNYPGVTELSVDANQFVQIKGSNAKGKKLQVYIDAQTGKILGVPSPQSEFFQWVTTLHRSLFLHGIGRLFVGISAFLLLLIAVSGTMLIIRRQLGVKHFFKRITRDSFAQYYHVVLGRWSLIPIIIIALTGTYLSLNKFGFFTVKNSTAEIDFDAIRSKPELKTAAIAIFKHIKLSQIQNVEFPFSADAEDYYTIKLDDRELTVNQITGDVLSEVKYPTAVLLNNLSLNLHTGRASAVWAIVLAVASANILFFIYSGFVITWKRISGRVKNKYTVKEAQFIILVGSENGSTFRFARAVHQQLLQQGKKTFITDLNHYTIFPKAEHLVVMTATYGLGEAPANAKKFAVLVDQIPQQQPVSYSVIGFGSKAYPDFCRHAFEAEQLLAKQSWATPLVDIHTVNDQSPEDFKLWAEAWSQQTGVLLDNLPETGSKKAVRLESLSVKTNTAEAGQDTFLIKLKPERKTRVTSGDLLAIYPANDHRERLYSIGLVDHEIQLSVRLHPDGLGSGFLHRLAAGETLRAQIIPNKHFHFPKKATEVLLISNGTGIAPFLGMISQNDKKTPCHLYCGFRDASGYKMYQEFLTENKNSGKIRQIHTAFSREDKKHYVSHLLARDAGLIGQTLNKKGVLMICGSLSMQKDVLDLFENICQTQTERSLSFYQSRGQILTDCY